MGDQPTIVVRPWGRIEGRRMDHGHPVVGQQIRFRPSMSYLAGERFSQVLWATNRQVTGGDGEFALDYVPPGRVILSATQLHPATGYSVCQRLRVEPGNTTRTEIDTQDRSVIAHIRLDPKLVGHVAMTNLDAGFRPDMDNNDPALWPVIPKDEDTAACRADWWDHWNATRDGQRRWEMFRKLRGMEIHADGSCVADLVEPGSYIFAIEAWEKGRSIVSMTRLVTIPPADGAADEPVDLGEVAVTPTVTLKPGDSAPTFSAATLGGEPLDLQVLRGRYVLLDFWATWCGPCLAEMQNVTKTYEIFGTDSRLTVVSLSLDADVGRAKQFVREHGMKWPQCFLGDISRDPVTRRYGVAAIPAIFLVGPDGRIVATDLRGDKIEAAVRTALSK